MMGNIGRYWVNSKAVDLHVKLSKTFWLSFKKKPQTSKTRLALKVEKMFFLIVRA